MVYKRYLLTCGLITMMSLWLTGCNFLGLRRPQVINHVPPELAVDMAAFSAAGCMPEEYGWTCAEDSPLADLDCDLLLEPSALLGTLDPAYPLMQCVIYPYSAKHDDPETLLTQIEAEGYFYNEGCKFPAYIRYIVFRDGAFQLLNDLADLQALFAPITSAEEALSYAMAATGYSAYYGLEIERGYHYFANTLEDTQVTGTEADGYTVHLFYYQFCGCGPHTTSSIDVQVSLTGEIDIGEFLPAFKDPTEDNLCID
ncbi:MAG: hypothetical protein JXA33_29545 [Anaerolineae bacterium]|nr:hypothetical protein [Anaerolineae bacterium]